MRFRQQWETWIDALLRPTRRLFLFITTCCSVARARFYFDARYYQRTYDDVAGLEHRCFRHFMEHGWREGRNPTAWFDTLYYRDVHLNGSRENPLLHYLAKGRALRLATRPADDVSDAYIQTQHSLCSSYFSEVEYRKRSGFDGDEALTHYLREGWRAVVSPSPLFDVQHHTSHHQYIRKHDVSPLYHFASQRRFCGEGLPLTLDVHTELNPNTLISRSASPTRNVAFPRLVELEPMPEPVRRDLSAIWQSGSIGGKHLDVHHLRDVFVTGEGLVFTKGAQLFDAINFDVSAQAVGEGALAIATAIKRGDFQTIDAAVLAKARGGRNYGHFILESLPRAWFARTRLGCGFPVLIQGNSPIEQVSREALSHVGLVGNEIIAWGDDPVHVRELVVVGGLARHPLYISPTVLDCYDEISSRVVAAPFSKIYAARGASSKRDFVDEPSVAHQLAAAGFHRASTGEMRFEEQVALFKGATHVIGVGGAALTNLLFCRPGTRVTILYPSSASEVLFWMIAELRGLLYEEVRCHEVGPEQGGLAWNRSINVTPANLAELLS